MNTYAILVLAAGSSNRLGTPKQLLPYAATTLLHHTLQQAVAVAEAITFAVINADRTEVMLPAKEVLWHTVLNHEAQEGIASSIRAGIRHITTLPGIEACILAVCDQPFISTALLESLIAARLASGKGIIASLYDRAKGTPVLFDKKYFSALLELTGDTGARQLLKQYEEDVTTVAFPEGGTDIDTEDDYLRLMAAAKHVDE